MYKNLSFSISSKIRIYFIFLIILILFSFGLVETIRFKEKQYVSILLTTAKNKSLSQRIAFLSTGFKDFKNYKPIALKKTINEYENNLQKLNSGKIIVKKRTFQFHNTNNSKALQILNEVGKTWEKYKSHIENLQIRISKTHTIKGNNTKLRGSIKNDLLYLQENTTSFFNINDKLYRYYYHKMLLARKESDRARMWYLIINLFVLFAGLILAKFYFFDPVKKIKNISEEISEGIFTQKLYFKQRDEFGAIAGSINKLLSKLDNASQLIKKLSEGNLDVSIQLSGKDDILNNSLMNMRDKFRLAEKEKKAHRVLENQRIWASDGLAKFSGLLRDSYKSIEEMSYAVLKFIIDYMSANQGGIFILNEEKTKFNLIVFHGYNRRKYIQKAIEPNVGLIGQCATEQKSIYLTEIPDEYITVTSGLGEGNPKSLLLIPALYDEKVIGVIELASFKEIKDYELKFIEDLASIYASTLIKIKVKINTDKLLSESQEQSERLSQQDEELRQNLEEMQATQEETERREQELTGLFNAINYTLGTYQLDLSGKIINANSIYIKWMGFHNQADIINKKHKQLSHLNFNTQGEYDKFWSKLNTGLHLIKEAHYFVNGNDVWLNESYTPVKNDNGEVEKILVIVSNITSKKLQEADLKNKIKEIKANDEVLKFNVSELERIKKMLEMKELKQQNEIEKLKTENDAKINQLIKREFAISKILEKSLNAVITFNEKGVIGFSNISSQQLTGNLAEDLKGNNIKDYLLLDYTFSTFFDQLKTLRKSKTLNFNASIKNKKGHITPVEIAVIESKLSSEINYTMFIKDIYNEKRFENERNELMEEFALNEAFYKNRINELEKNLSEPGYKKEFIPTDNKNQLIEWNDTYKLGIESIDNQHKKLIDIANKLYAGLMQKKGKEVILSVFKGLIEYAQQHFSFEENFFKQFNYPEQKSHIKSHQKFIAEIDILKNDFKHDNIKIYAKTIDFIQTWINHHILISDREYVELYKKNGNKIK
ncbi:MAG: bacteriohemerythrin [Chlorobi bacterium]|nr:bacteriohemerythrin [Chlorobiota bacterium]